MNSHLIPLHVTPSPTFTTYGSLNLPSALRYPPVIYATLTDDGLVASLDNGERPFGAAFDAPMTDGIAFYGALCDYYGSFFELRLI